MRKITQDLTQKKARLSHEVCIAHKSSSPYSSLSSSCSVLTKGCSRLYLSTAVRAFFQAWRVSGVTQLANSFFTGCIEVSRLSLCSYNHCRSSYACSVESCAV